MTPQIPALVLELARRVNLTPIAWKFTPDEIVIVFEEGPKLRFERPTPQNKPAPVEEPRPEKAPLMASPRGKPVRR